MIEALLVLLAVGLLSGLALVGPMLPPEWVVAGGGVCTILGLLLGVPTGFWYHVRLRACLLRRAELPQRWWLRPVRLHERLEAAERPEVMLWFALGGAGFGLTILGCFVVGVGVVLQAFRAGVFS